MGAAIDTAVLLAAGMGTRLRASAPVKALCRVAGAPLIDHALEGLAAAGLTRAVVVTGYEADQVVAHLARGAWPLEVETVHNPRWTEPNGVSVLAAAAVIARAPVLLAMCDHLVAPSLYARVARAGAGSGLTLGIDRRLGNPRIDAEDVTRVSTAGDRIVAIGKGLTPFDAYDVGVFAVSALLVDALVGLSAPSLTDGVRVLAAAGRAGVIDCGDAEWVDVDDPAALAEAEAWHAGVRYAASA